MFEKLRVPGRRAGVFSRAGLLGRVGVAGKHTSTMPDVAVGWFARCWARWGAPLGGKFYIW
jgi:hypothetical protein